MPALTAFLSGTLFAIGLAVAGMTQPAKVVGFLDVFGRWDASLAFVMGGAVLSYGVLLRLVTRRSRPVFGEVFGIPTRSDISSRLVAGAALFGLGWGLAGYCPGPGLTATATGSATPLVFVAAMVAGMFLQHAAERLRARGPAEEPEAEPEARPEPRPSPVRSVVRQ
ncbi:MAG: DUF6691 family protein [Myxococcota bacterium]